jgi:hypothetical protein
VFQIYVTSVLSGCCKNRLGVAPVAMRVKNEGVQAVPVRSLAARARMGARNAGSGGEVLARARGTGVQSGRLDGASIRTFER